MGPKGLESTSGLVSRLIEAASGESSLALAFTAEPPDCADVASPGDPFAGALHAGIAGSALAGAKVDLLPGLRLEPTYAHVFGPLMVAFARPSGPRQPHPGPWRSASGGPAWDIEVQLSLDEGAQPLGFDRLNTLWFTVALLRLRTALPIRIPVVSPVPFHTIAALASGPQLLTIETNPVQLIGGRASARLITEADTIWVRTVMVNAAALMEVEHIGAAFMIMDDLAWVTRPRAAVLMACGAIECALRPGPRNTGARLSRMIAALLATTRSEANRIQQRAAALYEVRGRIVHAGHEPEAAEYVEAVELARRVFMAIFVLSSAPTAEALLLSWDRLVTVSL